MTHLFPDRSLAAPCPLKIPSAATPSALRMGWGNYSVKHLGCAWWVGPWALVVYSTTL